MKEWIVKDTLNNKYVQELVRCKDCIFRHFDQENIPYCELPDHEVYPDDNWFCADGERAVKLNDLE